MLNGLVGATGNVKITDLQNCYACGGTHSDLEAIAYRRPNPPYTHWYMCPTAVEPVGIGLLVRNSTINKEEEEVIELHHRMLLSMATLAGKPFVFAAFHVNADGKVVCDQHSIFPNDKKLDCIDSLKTALLKSMPLAQPVAPLQSASQERLALFGGGRLSSVSDAVNMGLAESGKSDVQKANDTAIKAAIEHVVKNTVDDQAEPGKGE